MTNKELAELLMQAKAEVTRLREIINSLGPKAQAWDAHLLVLGLLPKSGGSASMDVNLRIDQALSNLQADESSKIAAATPTPPKPEAKAESTSFIPFTDEDYDA